MGTSTERLADAVAAAGVGPNRRRRPDTSLAALGDDLPDVSMDRLFKRLATFATETGPDWLAGDTAAWAAFADEARVLARVIDRLRSVAQQPRGRPPRARQGQPLAQVLGDGRVRAQLDRLALSLQAVVTLASRLAPLDEQAERHAPPSARTSPVRDRHEPSLPDDAWLLAAPRYAAPLGHQAGLGTSGTPQEPPSEQEPGAAPWSSGFEPEEAPAPSTGAERLPRRVARPLLRWTGRLRHRRVWASVLVAAVLLLVVSGTLALTHRLLRPEGVAVPLSSAQATAQARGGQASPATTARPSGTHASVSTAVPATSVPASARLAISPTSLVLSCTGTSVPVTLSDTGAQPLSWRASVSGTAVLSATSGTLGAHSSATITVHASGTQHGPGAISFTSNGGAVTVTYKVSCH